MGGDMQPQGHVQVLMNMIINARDALPGGGHVSIVCTLLDTGKAEEDYQSTGYNGYLKPGLYVKLVISDNGPGMDEETQQHIFEPFFTTKPAGKGIGLGLAIVYSIIKQNDGYISVASVLNRGTAFTIYFPSCST
jgi:signal transduction histidine kinase